MLRHFLALEIVETLWKRSSPLFNREISEEEQEQEFQEQVQVVEDVLDERLSS